jgi:transcriptional regulator with XRE-family HTH domain
LPEWPSRARHPDIAARMRKLRTLYGPTLTEFCATYRFSLPQWSNYEAGFQPSLAAAKQLRAQIHGLTLDWIYYGEESGLSVMMARTLRAPIDEEKS